MEKTDFGSCIICISLTISEWCTTRRGPCKVLRSIFLFLYPLTLEYIHIYMFCIVSIYRFNTYIGAQTLDMLKNKHENYNRS